MSLAEQERERARGQVKGRARKRGRNVARKWANIALKYIHKLLKNVLNIFTVVICVFLSRKMCVKLLNWTKRDETEREECGKVNKQVMWIWMSRMNTLNGMWGMLSCSKSCRQAEHQTGRASPAAEQAKLNLNRFCKKLVRVSENKSQIQLQNGTQLARNERV